MSEAARSGTNFFGFKDFFCDVLSIVLLKPGNTEKRFLQWKSRNPGRSPSNIKQTSREKKNTKMLILRAASREMEYRVMYSISIILNK